MSSNYYAWASGFSQAVMANADRPQLAATFSASLSAIRPDIALSVSKGYFSHRITGQISKWLQSLCLLCKTSRDIAVPEAVGHYMKANIPGSELVIVNTEGHFPQMSAPAEVATIVKKYIAA